MDSEVLSSRREFYCGQVNKDGLLGAFSRLFQFVLQSSFLLFIYSLERCLRSRSWNWKEEEAAQIRGWGGQEERER
jgi:hypothetical protein